MTYFHQPETNIAAHGMSSYEEAKFRDWNVDPELLCDPYDALLDLQARQEAEKRQALGEQSDRLGFYVAESLIARTQEDLDRSFGRISVRGMIDD